MDEQHYLQEFQKAADQLNKSILRKKQIEVAVGVVLDSVVLKLYKKSWANQDEDPLTARARIFFAIWVNDSTLRQQKLFYNIHALKLRHLKGYAIESTKFAELFRADFKAFASQWPNVSVKFGPLTLMEGWTNLDEKSLRTDVLKLANSFFEIEHLIDNTLARFKK